MKKEPSKISLTSNKSQSKKSKPLTFEDLGNSVRKGPVEANELKLDAVNDDVHEVYQLTPDKNL